MAMGMAHGWVGGTIAIVLCQTSEIDAIPDTARLAARDNVRRKSVRGPRKFIAKKFVESYLFCLAHKETAPITYTISAEDYQPPGEVAGD